MKQTKKIAIAIFGTGEIYRIIKETVSEQYEIIALFDNDKNKWGNKLDGLKITPPSELKCHKFEKIIIASSHLKNIAAQLISNGIPQEKFDIGANYIFQKNQKNEIKLTLNQQQEIGCNFSAQDSNLFWIDQSKHKVIATQHNTPTLISLWHSNNLPLFFELSKKYYNQAPGIFVDIGANIGTTTLEATQNENVTNCIAFEPESDNFSILMANIYLNKLHNKIEAHNYAVGERDEKTIIVKSPYCSGDNRIRDNGTATFDTNDPSTPSNFQQEEIKVVSIDSFLAEKISDIKFLWIDVQGYELKALKGCQQLISNGKTAIQIEYWPFGLRENNTLDQLNDFIKTKFRYFIDIQEYRSGKKTPRATSEITAIEESLKTKGPNAHTDIFLIK